MTREYYGNAGNNSKSASIFQRGDKWIMYGYEGDDELKSGRKNDQLFGGTGNDNLDGRWGDDQLFGEEGNDYLDGSDGDDYLEGGAGNDKLRGGWGDDQLFGGDGNDNITGNDGDDSLYGGAGSDELIGGWQTDYLIGVDPNNSSPGFGEIDILIGGGEDKALDVTSDTFVLGDSLTAYYQGLSSNDYANIIGFETFLQSLKPDVLILKGSSSNYSVDENKLFYQGDLIAVFDNQSGFNLSSIVSSATFV
jgi:Ca2+-binding RTX toxin-like protein